MQSTLFEISQQETTQPTWFQEILTGLEVPYGPGWPDRFGSAIRRWFAAERRSSIRTLSLFTGGGGLDIAFHDAGFDIVEMVEIEAKYVESLKENSKPGKRLENSQVLNIDIRDYNPSADLKIDFIIGGPPCQTFSAAGRRAAGVPGTNDPRGRLFNEYVRILEFLQPRGFLFENVYGITGAEAGGPWEKIQEAFRDAGYNIAFRVLDAADYGVPQHRERLFIVGLKEGDYLFPYPTHGPDSIGHQPFYTAGDAIADIDTSGLPTGINGRFGYLLTDIPPGLNYSFYTKELGHPSPVFSWRSKFSDFLYKADPNAPVRTIKAQGGQYTGPFSWENRPFTVAELRRLQTFPDDYKLVGGRQVCIEQIGNSVPPQLGRMLALSILNQVIGVSPPFPMHYLPKKKELGFRKRKRLLTELYAAKAKEAIDRLYTNHNSKEDRKRLYTEKNYKRFLSSNFAWTETSGPESVGIDLQIQLTDATWSISGNLERSESKSIKYEIVISPTHPWPLIQQQVSLQALDMDVYLFTGLWKAFEEILCDIYGVADLVQLSGYYQYKPGICANFQFKHRQKANELWQVISNVVQGVGVGRQLTAHQLKLLWQIDYNDVLTSLRSLRKFGYEVRNNNTNPQIPEGEYLIPYIFPTLSPKSVQLRKSLDNV